MREGRRIASAWVLSLVGHLSLVGVGAFLFTRSLGDEEPPIAASPAAPVVEEEIAIELPTMIEGSVVSNGPPPRPEATPLARGGGEELPRPDTGRAGLGGTELSEAPAWNLADRDDGLFLSRELLSRIDRNQLSRIETGAQDRASREDWRASRRPTELTFLASGADGQRPERRETAASDPSAGAPGAGAAARRGADLGSAAMPDGIGERPREAGGAELGGATSSPGSGIRDGRTGRDHRDSAAVAAGRPMVAEGTPAVPANTADKPRDTTDSEQEVATALQSIVHASTAGGAPGAGRGGQQGAGPTGSGGSVGAGSRAKALGTGRGPGIDNSFEDPRRTDYLRKVSSKIHPLWANAFPRWAAGEGLQGTVIVTFVINGDGTVASATISRPSGIPEFDENCRQAVLRAAPFGPLPPELGRTYRWSMPFAANNPAVLPKNPASGPP